MTLVYISFNFHLCLTSLTPVFSANSVTKAIIISETKEIHIKEVDAMKEGIYRSRRIRITAAVCAVVITAGGSAGAYALHKNTNAKAAPAETAATGSPATADNGIISSGGTVTSSQLAESLGLENTAVKLSVENVLAEQGETVEVGTPLYQITSDSLAKAEKTLNSELQTAKNTLLEQNISYQTDKNEAYLLYQSELLLGETAKAEYNNGIASLDSALSKAKSSYQEALDTIDSAPAEIKAKQAELSQIQSSADALAEKEKAAQDKADKAKEKYSSAANSYNSTVSEYNSAASVVRYIGKATGRDTSDIISANTVSVESTEQAGRSEGVSKTRDKGDETALTFEMPAEKRFESAAVPETPESSAESDDLTALYRQAETDYIKMKSSLAQAEKALETARSEYTSAAEELSAQSTELSKAQETVTELERELSDLENALSKAKSNISKLRSEYNSLNASYSTDQLELKNKLDTDMAAYENAEYHYQITCTTIEEKLEEKQSAYDTAEENLRIFTEELSEGYIYAKQDGTIYSLSYQEGRNANVNTPYVYYVDESGFCTTVELDQNDITQISIGDTAVIYSSETGIVNGRITAISEGTSTSLADVRFNVTVTADDGTALYVGQSVNVYFNYGDIPTGNFSDFTGSEGSDFGGGISGGFDPSNIPDFGSGSPGGFDPSNMPDFSRRKDN